MTGDDRGRPRRPQPARGRRAAPTSVRSGGRARRARAGRAARRPPRARPTSTAAAPRTPAGSPARAATRSTTRPAAPAVRVERAAAEIGQLRARRVYAVTSPTPPADASVDRLAAGVVVAARLRAPPRDAAERVVQLRDREHEHDADDRQLEREAGAEQAEHARRARSRSMRRPVSSKNDQNSARPTSAGTISQPERRSSRRYARRDATNAPAWPRSTSSSIPASHALEPLRARDARADLAHQVLRERAIVGIAGIDERRRRIEAVAGLDVHEAAADSGVDLEDARERDLAAERGHRVDRPLIVRERAVADAGQHDQAVVVGRPRTSPAPRRAAGARAAPSRRRCRRAGRTRRPRTRRPPGPRHSSIARATDRQTSREMSVAGLASRRSLNTSARAPRGIETISSSGATRRRPASSTSWPSGRARSGGSGVLVMAATVTPYLRSRTVSGNRGRPGAPPVRHRSCSAPGTGRREVPSDHVPWRSRIWSYARAR